LQATKKSAATIANPKENSGGRIGKERSVASRVAAEMARENTYIRVVRVP